MVGLTDPLTGEGLHDSAGRSAVQLRQGAGPLQHRRAERVQLNVDVQHGAGAVVPGVHHQPGGEAGGDDLLQTGAPLLSDRRLGRLRTGHSLRPRYCVVVLTMAYYYLTSRY